MEKQKLEFEARQVKKSKDVVVRMMLDRGFLPRRKLKDPSESFAKDPVIWKFKHKETQELSNVFWDLSTDPKMPLVQKFFADVTTKNLFSIVLVLSKPLVSKAKSTLSAMSKNVAVTSFLISELQFCLPDHVLVPKFTKLTEKEKREKLQEFAGSEDIFPQIQDLDPVSKWYGWRVGDMVMVERKEGILGYSISFSVIRKGELEVD